MKTLDLVPWQGALLRAGRNPHGRWRLGLAAAGGKFDAGPKVSQQLHGRGESTPGRPTGIGSGDNRAPEPLGSILLREQHCFSFSLSALRPGPIAAKCPERSRSGSGMACE